ncbi:MAG: HAD hydrolase family protein [Candidatus Omnitrophica bacterium]|nr:HAD hydrolase family protein [Candidatus Omnitrophota bacterium]MCM8817734.1 HAD hydrolase family protein [Candidatus Omnitrophota bacterium]
MNDILKIKLVATDVDGVLTNGRIYHDFSGQQIKIFSIKDGLAFRMLKIIGMKSAIVSGKKVGFAKARFIDFGVDFIFEDVEDKLSVIKKICVESGCLMDEVFFIGDDILDIPLLKEVGFSAAPLDAVEEVKNIVKYITKSIGGNGAFRECVEIILKGQGKWERALENLF